MAEYKDREHYIPLRQSDLVALLCNDLGPNHAAVQLFLQFNTLLSATFHYEYYQLLEDLKEDYAPFDPDAVTRPIEPYTAEQRAQKIEALYQRFLFLMERANFRRLSIDEVKLATKVASEWGLNMDVDFQIFDRFEVFSRGDVVGTRHVRHWWRLWKHQEVRLPMYKRLVLLVKLKPSRRLPPEIDTNTVLLKLFKDIPKVDMEMLLPGARLRMPGFNRLKLGGSLVGSGGWITYSIATEMLTMAQFSVQVILGPLAALMGYGYKQWFSYQTTKTAFHLRLTQSLYYQTLGTNLSVLFHLLDEAEEQECREALLAYYYLWRYAGSTGWTAPELDDYVEKDLERLAALKVDFEIEDALAKLDRLKLATREEDRYIAVPIERALEVLDEAWDNLFPYHQQPIVRSDDPAGGTSQP